MPARTVRCLVLAFALVLSGFSQAAAPQASASKYYTTVVKSDGTLWAWGRNDRGQLGDGTTTDRLSPLQIGTANDWVGVAAGDNYSLGLRGDGTLWAWGSNESGRLGDGTTTDRPSPVRIGVSTIWTSVAAGTSHTVALKGDGTLWAWGINTYGQLGDGTTTNQASPIRIGTATNWTAVTAGAGYTIALRGDGTLWAWGSNFSWQLGDGSGIDRMSPVQIGSATNWSAVAAGAYRTVALRSDGTLWTWGRDPVICIGVGGCGGNEFQPLQIGNDTDWSAVAAGASSTHAFALKTDGTLWAWGSNSYEELGDGTNTKSLVPVKIGAETNWSLAAGGYSHSIALRSDGSVWAWGENTYGQLGDGTNYLTTSRLTPVQIGTGSTWTAVTAALNYNLALRNDGTLWAWGQNNAGQLGDGTTVNRASPVQFDTATNWGVVEVGYTGYQIVALKNDGTLWARDANALSPLAQFDMATDWSTVASGYAHALTIKSDGTLWAWGSNFYGQIGDGTTTIRSNPVRVGTATNWTAVAAGDYYSLGLRSDGTLWAWGYNGNGQLGDGTTTDRWTPVQIGSASNWASIHAGPDSAVALKSDGTIWTWGSQFVSTVPVQLGTATNWAAASTGQSHSLAVKRDGTLWAWGSNTYGQLGDGTTTDSLNPVQTGTATNWTAVAVGARHSVARKSDGTLWAWGYSFQGQLGIGLSGYRSTPAQVAGFGALGGVPLNLIAGWNLAGNGTGVALNVGTAFGDAAKVSTVWKWFTAKGNWAFYTPTLVDGGAAYATSKGYDFLLTINAGEGFWVNAKAPFTVPLSGTAVPTSSFADGPTTNALPPGWSLIAIGDNKTPAQFASGIAASPQATGSVATSLNTLWAWDAGLTGWYFFAPSLVNAATQTSYIASKGYLDFGAKTLTPTMGFWVNRP